MKLIKIKTPSLNDLKLIFKTYLDTPDNRKLRWKLLEIATKSTKVELRRGKINSWSLVTNKVKIK